MKKHQVLAFYENLGIKVRVTEHTNRQEMMDYISGLRMCDTPYMVMRNFQEIVEIETFGMTRERMAELVEEFL